HVGGAVLTAEPLGELEATDAAKPQIEDDDARPCAGRELEPGLAGLRHDDPRFREHGLQVLADRLTRVGIVLDDHDDLWRARRSHRHHPASTDSSTG